MPGIAKNSFVYSAKQYGLLAFGLVRAFLLAHILGQSDYNYWVLFQIFIVYIDLSHLGLRLAASREIPIFNGQALTEKANAFSSTVLGGTLLLSVLVATIIAVFGLLVEWSYITFPGYKSSIIAHGLYLSAIMVVSEQTARHFLILLRTSHQFIKSSIIEVAYEGIRTAVICFLAFYYSAIGSIAGYVISVFCLAIFFLMSEKVPQPSFNIPRIRAALVIGIPLFFASLSTILVMSIDRIAALLMFTPAQLSVYGFALPIALLPVTALHSLRDVLFPSFGELSSTLETSGRFGELYSKALRISAIFSPIVTVAMLLLIDPIVHYFLPKFSQSMDILYFISGATIIFGIGAIPNSILLILRMHWSAFRIAIAASAVFALGTIILVASGVDELTSLIIALWLSYLTYTLFSIYRTQRTASNTKVAPTFNLLLLPLRSLGPVLIAILAMIVLRASVNLGWDFMYTVQCATLGCSIVVTVIINRDLLPELVGIVRKIIPQKK